MNNRIVLLTDAVEGVFARADPVELAGLGPLWAAQVERLGRLAAVELPLATGGALRGLAAADLPAPARILVCGECGSTMDAARWLCDEGLLGPWDSVLSPRQNAGRGQLRRPWDSPAGNLHASLRWPGPPGENFAAKAWDRLTPLAAGWMLARGLEEMGVAVEVKWPNDLLLHGRKMGGVLVEERRGTTVVGVGLNLSWAPPASRLRADHAVPAGTLAEAGAAIPPLGVWSRLVDQAQICYTKCLHSADSQEFIDRFSRRMAWIGRTVTIREGERPPYQARLLGVAQDGGLRLARNEEETVLYSGSVSLPGH